jgi:hypothetical protein
VQDVRKSIRECSSHGNRSRRGITLSMFATSFCTFLIQSPIFVLLNCISNRSDFPGPLHASPAAPAAAASAPLGCAATRDPGPFPWAEGEVRAAWPAAAVRVGG